MGIYKSLRVNFSLGVALLLASGCAGNGLQDPTDSSIEAAAQSGVLQGAGVIPSMPGISTPSAGSGLVGLLAQQLAVSQPQAAGGAGAIFQLAKSQMQASAFSKLSSSVPGMQNLLASAPAIQPSAGAGLGGMAGRLAGMMGNSGGMTGNMLGLASSFQQLGLAPSMVQRFVPVILQYVQTTGGGGTSSLLRSALMGGM